MLQWRIKIYDSKNENLQSLDFPRKNASRSIYRRLPPKPEQKMSLKISDADNPI